MFGYAPYMYSVMISGSDFLRYRYSFCELYRAELCAFLEQKQTRYKILNEGKTFSNGTSVPVYIKFELTGPLETIEELSQKYRCSPHIEAVYSEDEIREAALLWMTPAKQIIDIVNVDEAFSFSCEWIDSRGCGRAHHKEQVGTFKIRREPSSKLSTAIWAGTTGFAEVFADKRVLKLSEEEGLKGIQFKNVKLPGNRYSENIFQVYTENRIEQNCLMLGNGEKEIICPICGRKQYGISDAYQLHLNVDVHKHTADLYMTENVFGYGIAGPLYLVSQRFYRALRQNKLDRNISFDPVAIHLE